MIPWYLVAFKKRRALWVNAKEIVWCLRMTINSLRALKTFWESLTKYQFILCTIKTRQICTENFKIIIQEHSIQWIEKKYQIEKLFPICFKILLKFHRVISAIKFPRGVFHVKINYINLLEYFENGTSRERMRRVLLHLETEMLQLNSWLLVNWAIKLSLPFHSF